MTESSLEIHVRQKTKKILEYIKEGSLKQARDMILENKDTLNYNLGLVNFYSLIPRVRFAKSATIPKNFNALKMLIDTGFEIYEKEDKVDDLIFFAAAKCEPEKLKYCVSKLVETNPDSINATREGDTPLMFIIKYGNISYKNYPSCIKILIESGVDVNKSDYYNHIPILSLAHLFDIIKKNGRMNYVIEDNLRKSVAYLMSTKQTDITSHNIAGKTAEDLIKEHNLFDLGNLTVEIPEQKGTDSLFTYLVVGKEDAFIKTRGIKDYNIDDGSNTLLQLACMKNRLKAVEFLIKKGVDLSKTTEKNQQRPIEIAARRNYPKIFDTLSSKKEIVVDESLFLTFLREKGRQIRGVYFHEILRHKNLDVDIRSSNGNTPLHYAAIFSDVDAISSLLKRGASLTVKNNTDKSPLDYISAEELETSFDGCILPDRYYGIHDGKHEVAMNFRNLLELDEDNIKSELDVVVKICESKKLRHLVNHPLISSYLDIKWQLVRPFYRTLCAFQFLFYILTTLLCLNVLTSVVLGLLLVVVYGARIALLFNWSKNKFHDIVDISLMISILISTTIDVVPKNYSSAVTLALLATSFHLFWRFNPEFAQFHAILVNIIRRTASFLLYFSILLFCLGCVFITYCSGGDDQDVTSSFVALAVAIPATLIFFLVISSGFILVERMFKGNDKDEFRIEGQRYLLTFMEIAENLCSNSRDFMSHAEKLCFEMGVVNSPLMVLVLCIQNFVSKFGFKIDIFENTADAPSNKKSRKHESKKGGNKYLLHLYLNKNEFLSLPSVKLSDSNISKIRSFVKEKSKLDEESN